MGISDNSFFKQSIEKINSLKDPYFTFLTTLSSHYPFEDNSLSSFNSGEYEGSFLGNYFKSINYTDRAIGKFLESLSKEGTLEDSIIVIYGDHYAIPKDKGEDLSKFLNIDTSDSVNFDLLQKVPLLIHFPKGDFKGVNSKICGQIDIYPTLLNFLGVNYKYYMGNDLFSPKENVIFRNGSFVNGNIYYDSSKNYFYDTSKGEIIIPSPSLEEEKLKVLEELKYSDEILDHNLLSKINPK